MRRGRSTYPCAGLSPNNLGTVSALARNCATNANEVSYARPSSTSSFLDRAQGAPTVDRSAIQPSGKSAT
jgi:hypothetical protein